MEVRAEFEEALCVAFLYCALLLDKAASIMDHPSLHTMAEFLIVMRFRAELNEQSGILNYIETFLLVVVVVVWNCPKRKVHKFVYLCANFCLTL